MKTLLIDGNWCLKRNFYRKNKLNVNGEICSGSFGFIDSLRSVISKILPDRVVVMWDGLNSGYLRYEIYKPYKSNRKKTWNKEINAIITEGLESEEDMEIVDLLKQKLTIKNFLESLFIRHLEIDLIEADDLIAYYILNSKIPNEEIIIYSRDGDFNQLISPNVSILSPDNFELITINNFKKIFGYTVENALLFKCFEGDKSDIIHGVNGVTTNKLLENFPRMADEKYMFKRLVEECYDKKREKKLKFYDKIIESRSVLYRNAKLMNLKQPFVNEAVKIEMNELIYQPIKKLFSINDAMNLFINNGFCKFVNNEQIDMFFAPYYRIVNKEKEFNANFKK